MVPGTPALIQVGQTALRAADGSFLPSVPLFVLVDGDQLKNGLTDGEAQQARQLAQTIAGLAQISILTAKKENQK